MLKNYNIILNIGTHGDEKIGLKVANGVKKFHIKNGKVLINIANKRAFKKNIRFIDQDLNRSFPGKPNGNYEEKRAHQLLGLVKKADIVLDIHSTTSELKDALIVTKLNPPTKECIHAIAPRYALIMNATKNKALISHAKIGIAFEYGKDNDPKVIKKVTDGIRCLLIHLDMLKKPHNNKLKNKTVYFNVTKSVPKPKDAILAKQIKNYLLIKKGQVYARTKEREIRATRDFYPILFGNKNYEDIFGFQASRIA